VLVVSNLDLTSEILVMDPSVFLESSIKGATLNINTDYRYLKTGYYVSIHAEVLGNYVIPSSENIIDTSRIPILLLRAAKAGIPTLPLVVTDSVKKIASEFAFPVILFAVNPFVFGGYQTVTNRSSLYRAMKSLGMNYKFPVCAQPLRGKMSSFNSIFGKCEEDKQTREIAHNVYQLFGIPICKLHVQKVEEKSFLCGLQPLRKEELRSSDLRAISREVSLILKQGEPLVV